MRRWGEGGRSGQGRERGAEVAALGSGGGRSPSSIFLEQPLEREFTPFFLQMTARVCGGFIPLFFSPLGPQPKPKHAHRKGPQRRRASLVGSRKGKNPPRSLKGVEENKQRPT